MYVYDTGALVAAERGDTRVLRRHAQALTEGQPPLVPAPVLAQAWRGGPQAMLPRLLKGSEVRPMDEEFARQVGSLLAKAGRRDVVDASVIVLAAANPGFPVLTGDPDDLRTLAAADGTRIHVYTV